MTELELRSRVMAVPTMLPGDIYVNWTVFVDSEAVFHTTKYEEAISRCELERTVLEQREVEKAAIEARHKRTRRIYQR